VRDAMSTTPTHTQEVDAHLQTILEAKASLPPAEVRCIRLSEIDSLSPEERKKSKVAHFVRHGHGLHNQRAAEAGHGCTCKEGNCPYSSEGILDAALVESGLQQARDLAPQTQSLKVQLMCVSPMRRALQTAALGFPKEEKTVPWIAYEELREQYGAHVCDKRRPVSEIKQDFPHVRRLRFLPLAHSVKPD